MARDLITAHRAIVINRPHDGALELVKWIALAAMLVDHAGALLFHQDASSLSYRIGRISFPLFAFVLACKLSAKPAGDAQSLLRTVRRLLIWALVSLVPFYLAMERWWTPNIFFTLGLGVLACWVIESSLPALRRSLAWLGIFAASFGCDYFAPGVFLMPSVYLLYRRPGLPAAAVVLLCCAGIAWLTASLWAVLAIPIAAATHKMRIDVPRVRWLFYAIYPLHLLAIAAAVKSGVLQ